MNIQPATPEAIKEGAKIIRKGGIVAFPTETVYGLGADALNPMAVARIFEVKRRPRFEPLIVHIADFSSMETFCIVNKRARELVDRFWPGPLAIVLKKRDVIPDIVTAGLNTVGIRMPSHPVSISLIKESNRPIAAPSANPYGYLSPTTAQHVSEQIGENVDMILNGGKCPIGMESTIIELSEEAILLRPGGLPVEEIEKVIGKVKVYKKNKKKTPRVYNQSSYYSLQTPLRIIKKKKFKIPEEEKAGLLAFKPPVSPLPYEIVEVLSPNGDLKEAGANFFSCLYKLDKAGLDIIYAEALPEHGLGRAIMDRLKRGEKRR